MRRDHRPHWLIKLTHAWNQWQITQKIRPQFSALGEYPAILAPGSFEIFGRHIYAGDYLHIISSKTQPVKLSTWNSKQHQGKIVIGDYCLISPGASISSACDISIGDNCMIAAEVTISDCDWHGVYNRVRPFRCSAPILLENNVWVGLRSIIGKGVRIGENSIIGAGSVVTGDIPSNVIAAGNPAKIIKTLDPNKKMLTREFLFKNGKEYWDAQQSIAHYFGKQNSTAHWIRTLFAPGADD